MSRTIIKKKGSTLMVALASLVLTTTLLLLAAPVAPVAQAQEGAQYAQYPPGAEATGGSSGGEEELATLSFELAVEGTPPAGTAFYGSVPVEGSFDTRVALADPDGDGVYNGSTTINRFGPGPRPVPAGTEPVSLPIKILQGDGTVIKDFGVVKIDGDKTFSASVSFGDGGGGGQEVSANGIVEGLEVTSYGYGTHALMNGGTPIYALESQSVNLDDYLGKSATIHGTLVPGYENGLAGGPPLVEVSRVVEAAPPPDGGTYYGFRGTVTSISGSTVLVEEDPSSGSGDKGHFTVTDETELSRLVGGDALAPAAFEDLAVGQTVEATYAGAVAESYPTQGNAASIVILGEAGGEEESVTLSFELTVEGQPPADAAFFGLVLVPGGVGGLSAPLTDPDGDGLYAGSVEVAKYGPGPRPIPPGTEPMSVPVQIVQAPSGGVIKEDFGQVKLDGDKTFRASVSFGDDGGGTNPGGTNPIGTNPGATGDGGSASSGGSGGDGSGLGGVRVLPATGGTLPVLGIAAAGALLIGGGLLIRRLAR